MTVQEFAKELEAIVTPFKFDEEAQHVQADKLMIKAIRDQGPEWHPIAEYLDALRQNWWYA